MPDLKKYEKIVGKDVMNTLREKSRKFSKSHILTVNSTHQGGGVAELLNSMVIIFNKLGIPFGWRILHGDPDFFTITKKFHNGLQGQSINLSNMKKKIYLEVNRRFSIFTHIDHDMVIIHDPQPLPLIKFYRKRQPWIFRCHIDISTPNTEVWNYLKTFIQQYDHFVISQEIFRKTLGVSQSVMHPAIDPLTIKNRGITEKTINKYLNKSDIERDLPIISQISRFDKWKDPLGVIRVFEMVRKREPCQLVLLGSFASDDPEGHTMLKKVEKRVGKSKYKKDISLILNGPDILVNSLQRASAVVIQKSLREGFALTVSEALYKKTPVVASKVGGIPLQVLDGVNGYLHEPKDYTGFAKSILTLLRDEDMRSQFGEQGRTHIKKHFLITRLILDWLNLFDKYLP
ncbi:MAG: glycosyltransferase [Theionarchaea archaeon]|nr:glycosyltransferase [Theionarchaea archaeon]